MSTSTPNHRPKARSRTRLLRVEPGRAYVKFDQLATEEPLEIRLQSGLGESRTLAVTMRTPGHDFELAAGFLLAEGLIGRRDEIRRIAYCTDSSEPQQFNIVNVELASASLPELAPLERHFYTTSACGVCGKAGLENLQRRYSSLDLKWKVSSEVISRLPLQLRAHQPLFARTGGLHAAALFDRCGHLLALREDVGRQTPWTSFWAGRSWRTDPPSQSTWCWSVGGPATNWPKKLWPPAFPFCAPSRPPAVWRWSWPGNST
jgi:FdhD protein